MTTIENAAAYDQFTIVQLIVESSENSDEFNSLLFPFAPSEALLAAIYHGNVNIVKYLLEKTSACPFVGENEPIRYAVLRGHTEIVRMLMQYKDVDPSFPANEPLKSAVVLDLADIAALLLTDPRVRQADKLADILDIAIRFKSFKVADELAALIYGNAQR